MNADRPMRVLSVNASVVGGGAERVALTLHERYLARGLYSRLAVANLNGEPPNTLQIPRDAGRSVWARAVLGLAGGAEGSRALRVLAEPGRWLRVARGFEDFAFPWTPHLLELPPVRPDVLHLHNLHGGYFDVRALPALTAQVPTILTLHDTWLLTGHCAQPFECTRWREGCGSCPDLGRYVPIRGDKSAENREMKRSAVMRSHIGIAAPSRWLLSMVEEAGVLGEGREGRVIPNGVDVDVFTPGDRAAARERLGLPQDRQIVLVAAKGVRDNPYKGFDTLLEALERLPDEVARGLLVVALGDEEPGQKAGRVDVRGIPYVSDAATVAEYYRAGDVFVHPSRADSFPLAPIEAMACGIPVVVSDAGGLPEIVTDGENGSVFAAGVSTDLVANLESLLRDEDTRGRYATAGMAEVVARLTIDRQVDAYLSWYAELQAGEHR